MNRPYTNSNGMKKINYKCLTLTQEAEQRQEDHCKFGVSLFQASQSYIVRLFLTKIKHRKKKKNRAPWGTPVAAMPGEGGRE